MSLERAVELAHELRRVDGVLLDPSLDAEGVDALVRRRESLIGSLMEAAAADLAASPTEARERLASLVRESIAQGTAMRAALESRRDRALAELASIAPARRLAVEPAPHFTERVA